MDIPTKQLLNLALGRLRKRVCKDCKSQRTEELSMRPCLPVRSEAIPIKPHQHDCINMSSTGTAGTAIDMLTWAGKVHEASTSHKELQATKEGLRVGEVVFHREEKANGSPYRVVGLGETKL